MLRTEREDRWEGRKLFEEIQDPSENGSVLYAGRCCDLALGSPEPVIPSPSNLDVAELDLDEAVDGSMLQSGPLLTNKQFRAALCGLQEEKLQFRKAGADLMQSHQTENGEHGHATQVRTRPSTAVSHQNSRCADNSPRSSNGGISAHNGC